MTNHTKTTRHSDGHYHISGNKYRLLIGSRVQVLNGNAYKTNGGLTKSGLKLNKWGRIVSAKKHLTAKKENRLEKNGYFAKKGTFGFVKKDSKRRTAKRTTKRTKNDD